MTDTRKPTGDMLEDLFRLARADRARLDPKLSARILADAGAETARSSVLRRNEHSGGDPMSFARWIGGWPSLAGMVGAALAGLWVGAGLPEALGNYGTVLLMSETDIFLDELFAGLPLYPEEL